MKLLRSLLVSLTVIATIAALALQSVPGATASHAEPGTLAQPGSGNAVWQPVSGTPRPARASAQPEIKPVRFAAYTLDRSGMAALLASAPMENSLVARTKPLGCRCRLHSEVENFAVQESPIMEPGLAAKHPDIKTYSGRGLDNPAATLRFDLTPLGFHASVRSPQGAWCSIPIIISTTACTSVTMAAT